MSQVAIRARGLGKAYTIDHESGGSYRTLRDSVAALLRGRPNSERAQRDTLWALQDVSLEVGRGEALGIVGRNGAGKTTLLKILSRITQPTTGQAEVYGRLGSLLEVGTGFHPELTGRENIFLNGAILGMHRREIQSRFDEIVAFAETERFLDTPIKHYSSGMHMRLAFAVAAHLDSEILIVDEVLAVGDAEFQSKCLGKMEDVSGHGRTVLFVSHNLAAITQLCSRAVLLESGRIAASGPPQEIVDQYLNWSSPATRSSFRDTAAGTGRALVTWAELRGADARTRDNFSTGDDITVAFGLRFRGENAPTKLAVSIRTADGVPVAHVVDDDSGFSLRRDLAELEVTVRFRDIRLYPGAYLISIWVVNRANTEVYDHVEDGLQLRIADGGRLTMRRLPRSHGLIYLTPDWHAMKPQSNSAAKGV